MPVRPEASLRGADTDHAVEIADGVWWVGYLREGDDLQCHPYLIDAGDQSVLIDPGSCLTFPETLRKIREVMPFSQIRWFVLHHQDPDIVGAMPTLCDLVERDDAAILTHGRAQELVQHLDLSLPFERIEERGWRLELPDRVLRFVFTPYMHFPGAFCTFDERERVLFSSDIFGGYTTSSSFLAEDEGHFEAMRPWHEHYMPSRDVVLSGLARIERVGEIDLIAPQHGSLIPARLIPYMMRRLKSLDTGIYLLADTNTEIRRLVELNRLMHKVVDAIVLSQDFREVVAAMSLLSAELLGSPHLAFFASWSDNDRVMRFSAADRFRGAYCDEVPEAITTLLGQSRDALERVLPEGYLTASAASLVERPLHDHALLVPLSDPGRHMTTAVAVIFIEETELDDDVPSVLARIAEPLTIALARERLLRTLEEERQRLYEQSTRDSLTGLRTKRYLRVSASRAFQRHDRRPERALVLAMLDLDHFKRINDTYGHLAGDQALEAVGEVLRANTRDEDLAVRFGGEEFALLLTVDDMAHAERVLERVRAAVAALEHDGPLAGERITISAGAAHRHPNEDLDALTRRADAALYLAKRDGRNRVMISPD